jgi:isopentenyl-diphosphate delta-isomerase type 1
MRKEENNTSTMSELVILVDQENNQIGTMKKSEVHTSDTPLHRAFSVFLFDDKKNLLLQQRALSKITWPGVWSNSVCGHQVPEEDIVETVPSRIQYEIGAKITNLQCILPDFRYKATFQGIMEHEICPVFVGKLASKVNPRDDEVHDVRFVTWEQCGTLLRADDSDTYSPWCKLEYDQLLGAPAFHTWFNSL